MAAEIIDLETWRAVWIVVREACRACGHRSVSIVHGKADMDRLECSRCHEMASGVTHWIQEDGSSVPRLDEAK